MVQWWKFIPRLLVAGSATEKNNPPYVINSDSEGMGAGLSSPELLLLGKFASSSLFFFILDFFHEGMYIAIDCQA